MVAKQDKPTPLTVGDPAPDFTLLNTDETSLKLAEALTRRPMVVVFYRGDW